MISCGILSQCQVSVVYWSCFVLTHADVVSCFAWGCSSEQFTELGERLRIKVVPSFYFYKGGKLVDHFATRDKKRIADAINRHVGREVADGKPIY